MGEPEAAWEKNQEATQKASFFFVGGALALDFVNTNVIIRRKPRDLLAGDGLDAAWWQEARVHHPASGIATGTMQPDWDDPLLRSATRELRAALRVIFEAVARGTGVDPAPMGVLNHVLASGVAAVDRDESGHFHFAYRPRDTQPEAALLPVAISAADLLTNADLHRLRHCANEHCVLLFYDHTKSATRRWCSVGCMSRARSSERYRTRKFADISGRPAGAT